MAWREPLPPEEEKPDPVKELLKLRTWDQVWQSYVDEQVDDYGADPQDYATFN